MDMYAADWPLRASATATHPGFEDNSQDDEQEGDMAPSTPTIPHPPSLFSVDDYRSILKAQSPFSQSTVDEYVLDECHRPRTLSRDLYIPPRLAARDRLPRLPMPFASQIFSTHTSLSPHTAQSSPSLSSSITTAASSPDPLEASHFANWPFSEVTAHLEPLRTKRHFSSLRTAKRLPHRNSPPWEVHAIIQVRESVNSGVQHDNSSGKAQAPIGLGVTNDDSAHTPGINIELPGIELPGLPEDSVEPAPWTGRYVHYRGASFHVLNPHASLIYGARAFETPAAEIDGLLDDYFDSAEPLENDMDRSVSSTSGDGTPSRQLYDDPAVARRNILHLPSQSVLQDSPAQASQNTGDGESAMSAILAGYEHSTYPRAQRGTSTSSSSAWLDFVEEALDASPDLPIIEAISVARYRAYGGNTPATLPRALLTAGPPGTGTTYDPATTERTYGDTNRLLLLTPHAMGIARATARAPLHPIVRPESLFTDGSIYTSDNESTHGNIRTSNGTQQVCGNAAETDIDGSNNTMVFNPFNAQDYEREEDIDAETDWVTEAALSGAGRFSFATEEEGEHFDYYDFDNSTVAQAVNVRDNDAGRAWHRYEPRRASFDEHQQEVERAARTLSTIYHNKLQAMASGEHLAIQSGYASAHRRAAVEAEAEIERLRRESPQTFTAAVDLFVERYGEHTAGELTRIWTDNNLVGDEGFETPVSENSFDQVIRQARAGERAAAAADALAQTTAMNNENSRRAGLQYSPTANTFTTARPPPVREPRANRSLQAEVFTPVQLQMGTSHQLPAPRHHDQVRRPGVRTMASMSSQTGLRDLHLTSTPTSNINGTGQDIARRPGTPMYPRTLLTATPPRHRGMDVELAVLNTSGRTPMDATLRSINADFASRDLMSRHLWNPVALLVIWAGGFDKVIARDSRNIATEVSRETKIEALKWACLEISILIVLGSVIAMFIIIDKLAH